LIKLANCSILLTLFTFSKQVTAAIALVMLGYLPFGMTWNFIAVLSLGAVLSWVFLLLLTPGQSITPSL
jgi:hypothetical protein